MAPQDAYELACRDCGRAELTLAGRVDRLRAAGFLKRNLDPAADEVDELLRQNLAILACAECGGALELQEAGEWPSAPACESCGKPIPRERLEVFPDCKVCVACQQRGESGVRAPDEIDYCPRCGSPMTIRATRQGVTRYVAKCTSPGCRG